MDFLFIVVVEVLLLNINALGLKSGHQTGDQPTVVQSTTKQKRQEPLPHSCTEEFANVEGHTMCLDDDIRVITSGVSDSERDAILDYHNQKRASVVPSATDIFKLVWDDKLAAVAEKWAKQCRLKHDDNRDIPSYGMYIGQNMAGGHFNWMAALSNWYNEVADFRYGEDPDRYLGYSGFKKVGHYTQMVSNNTIRLGCGFASCRNTMYRRYYVCNYAMGQSSRSHPYTAGRRCGVCAEHCLDGLCDCGGKLCYNGGVLDRQTCACVCSRIYSDPVCSTLNCPPADPWYCGSHIRASDCALYFNAPSLCPHLCAVCEATSAPGAAPGLPAAQTTSPDDPAPPPTSAPTTPPPTTEPLTHQLTSEPTTPLPTPELTTIPSTKEPTTPPPTPATSTHPPTPVPIIPPVFVSHYNCSYQGKRPSPGECSALGDSGRDTAFCGSQGGQFTCHSCARYVNVKTDYCPVMCGLCDAPCGGLQCANGGTLHMDTCTCHCRTPHTGRTCHLLDCPAEDGWACPYYSRSFCDVYVNVPEECPFLCGLCAHDDVSTASPDSETEADTAGNDDDNIDVPADVVTSGV